MCADHDRASGEGVAPQEYTVVKLVRYLRTHEEYSPLKILTWVKKENCLPTPLHTLIWFSYSFLLCSSLTISLFFFLFTRHLSVATPRPRYSATFPTIPPSEACASTLPSQLPPAVPSPRGQKALSGSRYSPSRNNVRRPSLLLSDVPPFTWFSFLLSVEQHIYLCDCLYLSSISIPILLTLPHASFLYIRYGQTNCFVLPEGDYGAFETAAGDVLIISQRSARGMAHQVYETADSGLPYCNGDENTFVTLALDSIGSRTVSHHPYNSCLQLRRIIATT